MMDKKKSVLNVAVSISFKFILFFVSILVKRLLISNIGNDVNGLNSLYLSVIGFLSVTELGIGAAISYTMYKPIVENNVKEVSALYQLFKKAYAIIGMVIFVAGIALLPFLPLLAKGYTETGVDLYATFILMLVSVVLSYAFGAKVSLINAYKDNYKTTAIHSICQILQYLLQIVVLLSFPSFVLYLLVRIIAVSVNWIFIEIIARRGYTCSLSHNREKLSPELKSSVMKNIKAMFMHQIGEVLVNTSDNIVISFFVGISVLGRYSNYISVLTAMIGVISLFFTPLLSVIGHLFVSDKEKAIKYYNFFYDLNYIIGVIFFLGYYSVIDSLILILFGEGLELMKSISFVITVSYFIQFMRRSTLLFRNATGTFYNDRWKPFAEGLLNIVLSVVFIILFRNLWGDDMGIVGVLLATIITNLTICHIVEPYVLYKYAFKTSMKVHTIKNYCYIAGFVLLLVSMDPLLVSAKTPVKTVFINGSISLLFSLIATIIVVLTSKEFRFYYFSFIKKVKNKK